MKKGLTRIFLVALIASCNSGPGEASSFEGWVGHFRKEALNRGIAPEVFDTAFDGVTPSARVIELDRKQPERTRTGFSTYLKNVMSQSRIDNGRNALNANRQILNMVSASYGVPGPVVVALWGIETSYGKNTGGFDLITALSTLAWEGRRGNFFKAELLHALGILQGGHIDRPDFKGSWAGAMGQNQFMPSSWYRYAVDYNGDGHKDIWTTPSDVFASSANYLHQNGWDPALKWGWAVELPENTDAPFQTKEKRGFEAWLKAGVKFKDGPPSIPAQTPLKLIVPDGGDGRAYLVSRNYDTIMSWNRSENFALTVGLLSDFVATSPAYGNALQPAYNE